jgi:hypothetical protein
MVGELLINHGAAAPVLRNLADVLHEIGDTYQAVDEAIGEFRQAAIAEHPSTQEFAELAGDRLNDLIESGKGHCRNIAPLWDGGNGILPFLIVHNCDGCSSLRVSWSGGESVDALAFPVQVPGPVFVEVAVGVEGS